MSIFSEAKSRRSLERPDSARKPLRLCSPMLQEFSDQIWLYISNQSSVSQVMNIVSFDNSFLGKIVFI